MSVKIIMPKLGLTMNEGLIVEWKKNEGDEVKKGEILFVLETEKVTYEVEAPEDGILGKIIVPEKENVPVGAVVAYLLKPGESASELKIQPPDDNREHVEKMETDQAPAKGTPSASDSEGRKDRIKASPLAKKIAGEHGIDLGSVTGTGPGGRILREDVLNARDARPTQDTLSATRVAEEPAQNLVPFTGMRQVIAKNMLASKVETAQTYMSNTVDASKIIKYRKMLLPHIENKTGARVTITDLMLKITAVAIKEHPIINTRWTDQGILYLKGVHMGMAMALGEGLIVPVIRDVDQKSLSQIAENRLELIEKGKNNKFLPDDVSGSTFTLSALGMFGTEQFTANLNRPENGILAVGAAIDKPVAIDGEIVIRPMMNVTLTYDHRSIDGAEAAKFMRTLKLFVENPVMILA